MSELSGGVAVITGAAGGIGLGLARAAADRGMRVVIADLDTERIAEAGAALRSDGAEATWHTCDVRSPEQVAALRDAAIADMGTVDLVCANAGIGLARPVTDCSADDWDTVLAVNLAGVAKTVQAFLPHFVERGRGHLSATASLSGLVADPDLVVYTASKFGVVGLMEALAHELRRDHPGITASVLCPGPVATDLMSSSAEVLPGPTDSASPLDDEVREYLARGLQPDEVGRVAIEGIANGDFWLLPHPELTFALLDARLASMRTRSLAPEAEWTAQ